MLSASFGADYTDWSNLMTSQDSSSLSYLIMSGARSWLQHGAGLFLQAFFRHRHRDSVAGAEMWWNVWLSPVLAVLNTQKEVWKPITRFFKTMHCVIISHSRSKSTLKTVFNQHNHNISQLQFNPIMKCSSKFINGWFLVKRIGNWWRPNGWFSVTSLRWAGPDPTSLPLGTGALFAGGHQSHQTMTMRTSTWHHLF